MAAGVPPWHRSPSGLVEGSSHHVLPQLATPRHTRCPRPASHRPAPSLHSVPPSPLCQVGAHACPASPPGPGGRRTLAGPGVRPAPGQMLTQPQAPQAASDLLPFPDTACGPVSWGRHQEVPRTAELKQQALFSRCGDWKPKTKGPAGLVPGENRPDAARRSPPGPVLGACVERDPWRPVLVRPAQYPPPASHEGRPSRTNLGLFPKGSAS